MALGVRLFREQVENCGEPSQFLAKALNILFPRLTYGFLSNSK